MEVDSAAAPPSVAVDEALRSWLHSAAASIRRCWRLAITLCGGMGGAIMPFLMEPIATEFSYASWERSVLASSQFVGMWIGSIVSGVIAGSAGPGRAMMLSLVGLTFGGVAPTTCRTSPRPRACSSGSRSPSATRRAALARRVDSDLVALARAERTAHFDRRRRAALRRPRGAHRRVAPAAARQHRADGHRRAAARSLRAPARGPRWLSCRAATTARSRCSAASPAAPAPRRRTRSTRKAAAARAAQGGRGRRRCRSRARAVARGGGGGASSPQQRLWRLHVLGSLVCFRSTLAPRAPSSGWARRQRRVLDSISRSVYFASRAARLWATC